MAIHTITATGMTMTTLMLTDSSQTAVGDLSLLGLMQLVSPALPIGAFAWSQGLESAFELGWVNNEDQLGDWLEGVLEDGLTRCELPLLVRLQTAWSTNDNAGLVHWNQWLHATRETAELSDEDTRLGSALIRLLGSLELLPAEGRMPEDPGYVTVSPGPPTCATYPCAKPCSASPGPGWKTNSPSPAKPCPWATPPPNG